METFVKLLGLAFLGFLVVIIVAFITGFPIMWLWNWLMPALFGLSKISVWKAIGLNILCGLLFRPSAKLSSKND